MLGPREGPTSLQQRPSSQAGGPLQVPVSGSWSSPSPPEPPTPLLGPRRGGGAASAGSEDPCAHHTHADRDPGEGPGASG